jgi:hypothetical protein
MHRRRARMELGEVVKMRANHNTSITTRQVAIWGLGFQPQTLILNPAMHAAPPIKSSPTLCTGWCWLTVSNLARLKRVRLHHTIIRLRLRFQFQLRRYNGHQQACAMTRDGGQGKSLLSTYTHESVSS